MEYRIKTLEEFGGEIPDHWVEAMRYALGREISEDVYKAVKQSKTRSATLFIPPEGEILIKTGVIEYRQPRLVWCLSHNDVTECEILIEF